MHVDALLCDFATVREGLLHVLGGGATRAWRESFPAPLGLSLAMLITLQPTEARDSHRIRIVLQNADGAPGAEIDGQFHVQAGPGSQPGEQVAVPMVLNLHGIAIPNAGTYSLELLLDGHHVRSIPFVAALPDKPAKGPPQH